MAKNLTVAVNGQVFRARAGQIVLDAALNSGIEIPHDCRVGRCGTCIVSVDNGSTVCGETGIRGMVHACQARILSNLELTAESRPDVCECKARLTGMRDLSSDIVELTIAPEEQISYLPGQYFRFSFAGYPARAFSPTAPLDGRCGGRAIRLNVKRVRDGRVSPHFGDAIRPGHTLRMEGPFGYAFLRGGGTGRLVLVSSGTGFAPIWAVAYAALRENIDRRIAIIAGAGTAASLYMTAALARTAHLPNVLTIPAVEQPPSRLPGVRIGRPSEHVPALTASDIVYAAGSPRMVDSVAEVAEASGATFYSDPFESAGPNDEAGIVEMIRSVPSRLWAALA